MSPGTQNESFLARQSADIQPSPYKVVYLASPIDRVQSAQKRMVQNARDDVRVALYNRGITIFDPHGAWAVPVYVRESIKPLPPAIGKVDFAALDASDGVLAILPNMPPSIGVPVEIERALAQNIPVVVLGETAAFKSPLLAGRVRVFNMEHYEAAVTMLEAMMEKKPIIQRIELKVVGDGRLPTRSHEDDCGLDLYTYIDETIGMTQGSINHHSVRGDFELFFKNPDHLCVPSNFDHASYRVDPGQFVDIDCGISVEFPPGAWGLITGRSSAIRRRMLLIPNGIIDTGYRGRLFMPVLNVGRHEQFIAHGERIGQLILMSNATLGVDIRRVDFLSPSERGEAGRGSTGK